MGCLRALSDVRAGQIASSVHALSDAGAQVASSPRPTPQSRYRHAGALGACVMASDRPRAWVQRRRIALARVHEGREALCAPIGFLNLRASPPSSVQADQGIDTSSHDDSLQDSNKGTDTLSEYRHFIGIPHSVTAQAILSSVKCPRAWPMMRQQCTIKLSE